MSEAAGTPVETSEPEKKKRTPRPYWVLIPVTGAQTFEVHRCLGQPAVRKLLDTMEIDSTDERIGGIKVLAKEIPFNWKTQTVFKFRKVAEDEAGDIIIEDDGEEI